MLKKYKFRITNWQLILLLVYNIGGGCPHLSNHPDKVMGTKMARAVFNLNSAGKDATAYCNSDGETILLYCDFKYETKTI